MNIKAEFLTEFINKKMILEGSNLIKEWLLTFTTKAQITAGIKLKSREIVYTEKKGIAGRQSC